MIFSPLAIDLITQDSGVSLGVAILVGGILLGAAVVRAVQGEIQRRHDQRIKKLEDAHDKSPLAVNAEKIRELELWKQEVTRQLHDLQIHQARMEERSAAGSTTAGTRPPTGRQKKVDR